MNDEINIEKTQLSPKVKLNKEKNTFIISGKSAIENAHDFYKPVLNWFTNYFNNPNEKTEITLFLEYLNSSSSLQIGNLIHLFGENTNTTELIINWLYDSGDDLMEEIGKEFQYTYEIKLNFKEVNSDMDEDFEF